MRTRPSEQSSASSTRAAAVGAAGREVDGTPAVVLCSFEDGTATLIYNITNDYLLTIQQNKGDLPSTGFNVDCPYNATVSQETVTGVDYAFTVTVSPA